LHAVVLLDILYVYDHEWYVFCAPEPLVATRTKLQDLLMRKLMGDMERSSLNGKSLNFLYMYFMYIFQYGSGEKTFCSKS